jgi:hypothetical protein
MRMVEEDLEGHQGARHFSSTLGASLLGPPAGIRRGHQGSTRGRELAKPALLGTCTTSSPPLLRSRAGGPSTARAVGDRGAAPGGGRRGRALAAAAACTCGWRGSSPTATCEATTASGPAPASSGGDNNRGRVRAPAPVVLICLRADGATVFRKLHRADLPACRWGAGTPRW